MTVTFPGSDFCLSGNFKQNVYINSAATMEALQTEMRIAILEMKENEIKRMSHNPIRMLQDIICSRRLSY
jgi:ethanolamine utilization cobalamin adenosyltransferase